MRGHDLLKAELLLAATPLAWMVTAPIDEAPPFRVVMKSYPAASLTEALGEGLVTGHADMPEFKFAPEDVGAIVELPANPGRTGIMFRILMSMALL